MPFVWEPAAAPPKTQSRLNWFSRRYEDVGGSPKTDTEASPAFQSPFSELNNRKRHIPIEAKNDETRRRGQSRILEEITRPSFRFSESYFQQDNDMAQTDLPHSAFDTVQTPPDDTPSRRKTTNRQKRSSRDNNCDVDPLSVAIENQKTNAGLWDHGQVMSNLNGWKIPLRRNIVAQRSYSSRATNSHPDSVGYGNQLTTTRSQARAHQDAHLEDAPNRFYNKATAAKTCDVDVLASRCRAELPVQPCPTNQYRSSTTNHLSIRKINGTSCSEFLHVILLLVITLQKIWSEEFLTIFFIQHHRLHTPHQSNEETIHI